jgi:hypothetical protein
MVMGKSVADPGCFYSGSEYFFIADAGSDGNNREKEYDENEELSTPKMCRIRDLGSGKISYHIQTPIQGVKRHRIPYLEPQHWLKYANFTKMDQLFRLPSTCTKNWATLFIGKYGENVIKNTT